MILDPFGIINLYTSYKKAATNVNVKVFKRLNRNTTTHASKSWKFVIFKCFLVVFLNHLTFRKLQESSCRKTRWSLVMKQPFSSSAVITAWPNRLYSREILPQSSFPRKRELLLAHNSGKQRGGIIPRGSLRAQRAVYWLGKWPRLGI